MDNVSPIYLTVVCLANSRKHGGRCVAGKVLDQPGRPYWVRPISERRDGSLSLSQICLQDGSYPGLLDILEVPVKCYTFTDFQVENVITDDRYPWLKKGRYAGDLTALVDDTPQLWQNNCHDCKGTNDRIPISEAGNLSSSLLLIKPSVMYIRVVNGFEKKAVRARFCYKSVWYDLKVTDPRVEARYLDHPLGSEKVMTRSLGLCISLGVAFEGYIYKLVAGVIGL